MVFSSVHLSTMCLLTTSCLAACVACPAFPQCASKIKCIEVGFSSRHWRVVFVCGEVADEEHLQDAREKQDMSSVRGRWCKLIIVCEPVCPWGGPEPRAGAAVQADGGPTSTSFRLFCAPVHEVESLESSALLLVGRM